MKTFILARQSVGDNEQSISIDSQVEECRKLCAAQGHNVVDIFKDYNTSGRKFPSGLENVAAIDATYQNWLSETGQKGYRNGLGEAMKRINEVEAFVCYDITRLYRPLNGSFLASAVNQILIKNNVKVLTVKEGVIDFKKFTDLLITNLTSSINSEQLQIQKAKAKAALRRLKEEGAWINGLNSVYGYRSTGRRHEVEIVPDKAEVVKKAFASFLNGATWHSISRETGLSRAMLRNMMHNPAYAGYARIDGSLVKLKPLEGKALISMSEWEEAQKLLEEHAIIPKRDKKRANPLRGKVRCGICGSSMAILIHKDDIGFYTCIRHREKMHDNCHISIRTDRLLDSIYKLCLLKLIEPETDNLVDEKKLQEAEDELRKLDEKSQSLNKMFLDDEIDSSQYKSMAKELKLNRASLMKTIRDMEQKAREKQDCQVDWDKNAELMQKIVKKTMTPGELERVMNELIEKIVVYKEKIAVYLNGFGSFELPIVNHKLPNALLIQNFNGESLKTEIIFSFASIREVKHGSEKTVVDSKQVRVAI